MFEIVDLLSQQIANPRTADQVEQMYESATYQEPHTIIKVPNELQLEFTLCLISNAGLPQDVPLTDDAINHIMRHEAAHVEGRHFAYRNDPERIKAEWYEVEVVKYSEVDGPSYGTHVMTRATIDLSGLSEREYIERSLLEGLAPGVDCSYGDVMKAEVLIKRLNELQK